MKIVVNIIIILYSISSFSQSEYYLKSHDLVEKIHKYGRTYTYISDNFDLAQKSLLFKEEKIFDELLLKLLSTRKRRVDTTNDTSIYEKRDSIDLDYLSIKSNWTVLDYDENLTPKFWNSDLLQYVKTVKELDFKWRTSNYSVVGAVLFNRDFSIICMGTRGFYRCRVFECIDGKWILQMGLMSPNGLGKE